MNKSERNEELSRLQAQLEKLDAELMVDNLDSKQRAVVAKERAKIAGLVSIYKQLVGAELEIAQTNELLHNDSTGELKEYCAAEIDVLTTKITALEQELDDLLFPPDPRDKKPAFLEIRAGAGGQEASLFVGDLMRMYQNYSLTKGWEFFISSFGTTDVGGYREIIAYIKGKNVYKILKYESGVHRVQRVPKTETAGRIHTSTVTVAVMPEVDDVDVDINPSDLRIDVYRSSGAGGQHVNTTDSAVRITHIPTGVVVSCQQERSQHKNKERAMKELKSRIVQAEQEKQESEQLEKRKQQIGSGDRSEKIRTYNYAQNRVTDHRIDLTLKKLDMIIEGDLEDVVQPLIAAERQQRVLAADKH